MLKKIKKWLYERREKQRAEELAMYDHLMELVEARRKELEEQDNTK